MQYKIQMEWLRKAEVPTLETLLMSKGIVAPADGASYFFLMTGLQVSFYAAFQALTQSLIAIWSASIQSWIYCEYIISLIVDILIVSQHIDSTDPLKSPRIDPKYSSHDFGTLHWFLIIK